VFGGFAFLWGLPFAQMVLLEWMDPDPSAPRWAVILLGAFTLLVAPVGASALVALVSEAWGKFGGGVAARPQG